MIDQKTIKTKVPEGGDLPRLIPVPGEKIDGHISDYDLIQDQNGKNYKILEYFEFKRGDIFPGGLMLLATGTRGIDSDLIWKKYQLSKHLFFVICKLIRQ